MRECQTLTAIPVVRVVPIIPVVWVLAVARVLRIVRVLAVVAVIPAVATFVVICICCTDFAYCPSCIEQLLLALLEPCKPRKSDAETAPQYEASRKSLESMDSSGFSLVCVRWGAVTACKHVGSDELPKDRIPGISDTGKLRRLCDDAPSSSRCFQRPTRSGLSFDVSRLLGESRQLGLVATSLVAYGLRQPLRSSTTDTTAFATPASRSWQSAILPLSSRASFRAVRTARHVFAPLPSTPKRSAESISLGFASVEVCD